MVGITVRKGSYFPMMSDAEIGVPPPPNFATLSAAVKTLSYTMKYTIEV